MFSYKKLSMLFSTALFITIIGQAQANAPDAATKAVSETLVNENNDFPGRKKYAHVPYISIEQLYNEYDDIVIVDARSPYEFETLRILSAVNIPLSLNNSDYTGKLQELREKNPGKKIVFYCNGHTCMKSYKAVHRAKVIAKLDNVMAFDAGIFDWANAHPDKAILLDKTPVDLADLISKEEYKKHVLPAVDFINNSAKNTIILDVRSRHQREGLSLFSGYEMTVPMGDKRKLNKYIQLAKNENKKLFIYDAVGKQVRWLQYYLEQQNAGEYYFMEGGAAAYYKIPNEKLLDKD
jgi:rhodanese-related sulfurtransferase